MYELLLKWGFDNLSKFTGIKAEQQIFILQDAIKTKNAIIIERYKKCWVLNENLINLAVEIEEDIEEYIKKTEETDGTWKSARQFIGQLRSEFHPSRYRKLMKIRSAFEGTNDLISAYTFIFLDMIHIDRLVNIVKETKLYSRGDICRLYRGMWTKYCEVVAILLRITSNDLRFWITDTPYISYADKWAESDLQKIILLFRTKDWHEKRCYISLESRQGINKFWRELEEYYQKQENA